MLEAGKGARAPSEELERFQPGVRVNLPH
jgi:hypothetical protein